ncbi:MAG: Fur family transcriptional regulator [Dehalococcoidia bacterium]
MIGDDDIRALLHKAGYRLTPQRLMVVEVLRGANGHRSASQLLEQVQRVYAYVDISTVYRTLAMLKQLRLVTETDMGAGEAMYEWATAVPHHHLICNTCGTVQSLDHEVLVGIGRRLLDEYGFQADIIHFAIFGICRQCQNSSERSAHSARG